MNSSASDSDQSPTVTANNCKRVRFSFTEDQKSCDGDEERTKIFKSRRRSFVIQRKKELRRLGKLKTLSNNEGDETVDSTTATKKVARHVKVVVKKTKKDSSSEREKRRQSQRRRAERINRKEGWSTRRADRPKSKKPVTKTKLSIRRSSSANGYESGNDVLSITTEGDADDDVRFSSPRVDATSVYMKLRLQIPVKNSITTVVVTADKDRPIANDIPQTSASDSSGKLSDSDSMFGGPVIKDAKVCPKSCKCPPPEVWFKCELCCSVYDSLEKVRWHRASFH